MRIVLALAALLLATPLAALAALPVEHEELGVQTAATAALPGGKVQVVLSPTSAMPLFTRTSETFRIELSPDPGYSSASHMVWAAVDAWGCLHWVRSFPSLDIDCAEVWLTPRGSTVRVSLDILSASRESSASWPDGRDVFAFEVGGRDGAAIPAGLYDLSAYYVRDGDLWYETQPRAVAVVESYAAKPRIAVIGDPQVGDGRAFLDAEGPEEFAFVAEKTAFSFPQGWQAWSDVASEVNAWGPDFVLVTGDITFGQDAPGKYLAEYEAAWNVLQQFEVPTFLSLGNHDGYVQGGIDGLVLWERYFGPTHYSRDYGPNVHLVALNTYDWTEMDRMGVSAGVSAWGGQVRDENLAWIAADLAAFRARSPDGLLFTFAHHNPSWAQDDWPYRTGPQDGAPVVEQVARGAASYPTGQHWSGANRLELRDLLRANGVTAHFAGHTHQDRVARDDHGHGIVETSEEKLPGMTDADLRLLHYVFRDGTWGASNQTELAAKLADWARGPFYVDTTTAASDTYQYWGWRQVVLDPDADGDLDVAGFGWTPPSQAWLDANTNQPKWWNVEHAPLGLFSKPLYYDG